MASFGDQALDLAQPLDLTRAADLDQEVAGGDLEIQLGDDRLLTTLAAGGRIER